MLGLYLTDNIDFGPGPPLQSKELPLCKSNAYHNGRSEHSGDELRRGVALVDF